MGGGVLLVLIFYVAGLFYGLCGNSPHDMYTGDCCDRGTGANLIAVASYLTFLLGCPLLLLTTAHFLLGTGLDQLVCRTLQAPGQSDLLREADREFLRPALARLVGRERAELSAPALLESCHLNQTLYTILQLDRVYDVSKLRQWRDQYNLQAIEAGLVVTDLPDLTLLSREAEQDLALLARSELTRLSTSKYDQLAEDEIFRTDIRNFVRQLERLREVVGRNPGLREVAVKLGNPAGFLDNMLKVGEQVRLKLRQLKQTSQTFHSLLQLDSGTPLGENVLQLVETTKKAGKRLARTGPGLLRDLTATHVQSSLGRVDQFVELIVSGFHRDVGHCSPLSNSYNATVVALCQEIVQPFNGFWAAVGWCCLLYLPCSLLSLCLTSLYRKTEKYPGPVVDAEIQPLDGGKVRPGTGGDVDTDDDVAHLVREQERGGDTDGATAGLSEPLAEHCLPCQWRRELTAGTGVQTGTRPATAATPTSARPPPPRPAGAGRGRDLRPTILPTTRLARQSEGIRRTTTVSLYLLSPLCSLYSSVIASQS